MGVVYEKQPSDYAELGAPLLHKLGDILVVLQNTGYASKGNIGIVVKIEYTEWQFYQCVNIHNPKHKFWLANGNCLKLSDYNKMKCGLL